MAFNKYFFPDVYGFEFGARANVTKYPDPENNEFEIEFRTPNHSEEDVRFAFSTMAFVFFRKILKMEVWDGDTKLYESNQQLSMFVNESGEDPWKDDPTGHPKIAREPRTTHLKPSHTYTLKVYRTVGPSPKNPISVQYYGTDANQVDYGSAIPKEGVPMTIGDIKGMFIPE